MSKSTARTDKNSAFTSAAMSFVGVLAAVPVALSLYGAPDQAAATANGPDASQALSADASYAQYAYAYTQGYLSNNQGAVAGSSNPGTCGESTASAGATRGAGSEGRTLGAITMSGNDKAVAYAASHQDSNGSQHMDKKMAKHEWMKNVQNSYKTYNSASTTNNTTINNKNSNNVVGSNNYSSNRVEVKDSKGVKVHASNDSTTTNVMLNESLNKDSYNTTTKTETNNTAINNSYNKEMNMAVDSGNTNTSTNTNTTTNTTNTNVEADVDINSNNTTKIETETNTKVDHSVNDSNNSSDDDVIIKKETEALLN